MGKAQGKINSEAGISESDLSRLSDELAASLGGADQNVELERLKKQIAALMKDNEAKAKQLSERDEVAVKDKSQEAASVSRSASKARYAILVDEGHDQNDTPDVFVGVNGRSYLIRRGVRAEVPVEVLNVLNDAVVDKHIPVKDEQGYPNGTITRASRRFPYQNFGKVIDEQGVRLEA